MAAQWRAQVGNREARSEASSRSERAKRRETGGSGKILSLRPSEIVSGAILG